MWFKQIQLFQLADTIRYSPEEFTEKLEPFAFTSCLPSFPSSAGWSTPFDDDGAPLVHALNGYILFCLQIEDKILPATVIRQELNEKVKEIEAASDRKVRQKEKLSLRDEITMTLLPRAFSKFTRLYAYIDTKNNWLVLNSTSASRTEEFLALFKKSVTEAIQPIEVKKVGFELTQWLKTQNYPTIFSVEDAGVLQDLEQQNRVIRCQHQDLFATSIQGLLKDGCTVKQLAICWQDRVNFVLADDFSLRSIKYEDEILQQVKEMDVETKQQQFDADFFIMTEVLTTLLKDLVNLFAEEEKSAITKPALEVA
ncbi:MAG: recombination-associated protein RdgC [Gammaproteobacteria bacterium]